LEWTGDKADEELKHICKYLEGASKADDLREYNREKLKLVELSKTNLGEIVMN